MAYTVKPNTGSLWINDRKEKDTHPDRTGTINVEGVEYFIDGWLKETPTGKKFLSLSVKRKNQQGTSRPAPDRKAPPARPISKPRPPGSQHADPDAGITKDSPDADPNF